MDAARRGELILRRTQDFGKTFLTIAKNIFSFGYIGGFLFTSVMEKLVRNCTPKHGLTHMNTLCFLHPLSINISSVRILCVYRVLLELSMCPQTRVTILIKLSYHQPLPNRWEYTHLCTYRIETLLLRTWFFNRGSGGPLGSVVVLPGVLQILFEFKIILYLFIYFLN